MTKNENNIILKVLIFLLVLVILFWIMPDEKIETIGDFFYKIIAPLSIPISVVVLGKNGLKKYREITQKNENNSP